MEENNSQIIIYQTESGETKLDVRFQDETVWLTQKLMAELFQTTPQNITIHLKNIFDEGELEEKATCLRKFYANYQHRQIFNLAFKMNKLKTKYKNVAQCKSENLSHCTAPLAIY